VEPTGSRLSRRKNRFRSQRPAADTGQLLKGQFRMNYCIFVQCCRSGPGFSAFLTPESGGIWDGEKSGLGINIPDNISESLVTFSGLKIITFLLRFHIRDPMRF
jgi:hypothetical protein